MFKDYDKYLSTSLKVYLFVLICIFIMKLVGLDYFGLDVNNRVLIIIDKFVEKYNLEYIWYGITLWVYTYIILSITCVDNSKKMKIYTLFTMPINMIEQLFKSKYNYNPIFVIIDFIWLFIISMFYIKFIKKSTIKKSHVYNYFIYSFINIIFQVISIFVRDVIGNIDYNNFILMVICNFDYIILSIIAYKIYFNKGGNIKWEVGSFSLKKLNLKNLQTKLLKSWRNFKKQDKVTKLTNIIYFILSLIWNVLSVVIILIVAMLNDTFIECIFILTSFWLSKRAFGKAFHFSNMAKCFVVSNLSYYILNRLTTPLGISIVVPILLGVGLSYVTSKFVKKTYKPLYRGMPENLFEETILLVVDKDSLKYKICYDFYINKKSIVSLSIKYNYTEAGIRKIKDRVNDKIKRLNQ